MTQNQPILTIELTVYTLDQLADVDAPQIALAGRSNVGKSSLLNCLAGRKGLAKVSASPGKTRSINFFRVEPDGFYLVDLPGYGFAQRSKQERAAWGRLIERYFQKSFNPKDVNAGRLMGVCVLLDSRLPPQRLDIDLVAYVQANSIPLIPVLTKADKCSQAERAEAARLWQPLLKGVSPLLFSSKTGLGRDALWQELKSKALPGD